MVVQDVLPDSCLTRAHRHTEWTGQDMASRKGDKMMVT